MHLWKCNYVYDLVEYQKPEEMSTVTRIRGIVFRSAFGKHYTFSKLLFPLNRMPHTAISFSLTGSFSNWPLSATAILKFPVLFWHHEDSS